MSDKETENKQGDGNTPETDKEVVVHPNSDANAVEKFVRTAIEKEKLDGTTQTPTERPTVETYNQLEDAFDYFNDRLFFKHYNARLPHIMFTIQASDRFAGYYDHHRWHKSKDRAAQRSEIALNPRRFGDAVAVLSTLVHEMVHLANAEMKEVFGKPGKGAYHSKAWAEVMERIGLMPSSTGKPGGQKTGFRMTHYVIEGGPFDLACREYLAHGASVPWVMNGQLRTGADGSNGSGGGDGTDGGNGSDDPTDPNSDRKNRSKTKYSCPRCELIVRAKPRVNVLCGDCMLRLQAASD